MTAPSHPGVLTLIPRFPPKLCNLLQPCQEFWLLKAPPLAVFGAFKPPGLNQQLKSLKLPEVTPAEHLICIYKELNLLSQSPLASPFPASDGELRALILAHQIPPSPAGQGASRSLMLCDPGPRCHLAGDGWVCWCSCSNLFWPLMRVR